MALSSSSSSFTYDVFLSFRGTDTRHNFIGFLYKALCDKGFCTFIDDEKLPRGDEITPSLVEAIKESKIAIPVFSENYASSSFCLDELVNIIEQVKGADRLILPVFYKVDPSHVRHQTGSYGEALAKHEERLTNNMERLQKWKMALQKAANLSGMHFKPEDGYEYNFIEKIVEEISNKISRRTPLLHVAYHPVGLESRMQKVKSLLDVESDDKVLMVGIYGLGGIGKTTLARAVYNSIANSFEGSCFLHNVRENSTKHGLEHLQKKLLSKTVGFDEEIGHFSEGISIIKEKLLKKKVFLILDDVDDKEQLEVMVGEPSWFGLGSRIVITTRDKQLLANHVVERAYEMDELNEEEALELFKWSAFKNNDKVDPSYENILNEAVAYASGLPLALEVIGSLLCEKSIQEWRSAIDSFKKIPSKKILDKLKISYNALEENQQKIFLDITCCFKEYKLKKIEEILSAHYGVCVKYDIGVLIDKSLIKIDRFDHVTMHDLIEEDKSLIKIHRFDRVTMHDLIEEDKSLIKIHPFDRVTMHDLIEEMGKEIDRQESPKEPGKRSRLWFHKDIIQVLEENMGTSETEMIYLNSWFLEEVKCDDKVFDKMKNLKTLIIKKTKFCKGPQYLPKSLRVLQWKTYPSRDLPFDFPKNLSICGLSGEFLTSFEMHGSLIMREFMNMRVLKLDGCINLTRIADVSCFPNLETLSFKYCQNLVTIPDSVGLLHKLKVLDAKGCSKIKKFPPLQLPSLEELVLSHCLSLESFPEILVKMKNMRVLNLDSCRNLTRIADVSCFPNLEALSFRLCGNLVTIPDSVGLLHKLKVLDAHCCSKIKKFPPLQLPSLEELVLFHCSSLESFPEILVKMENMSVLKLDWCENLTRIADVSCFPNLKTLSFRYCGNLVTIPDSVGLLHKLEVLDAEGCSKIKKFPSLPLPSLKELNLSYCSSLESFPEILVKMENMRVLKLESCENLIRIADVSCFPNLEGFSFAYCGNLVIIHNSVGLLEKLEVLVAEGCSKIKKFPPLQLPSLEKLVLSDCSSLESFPEILVKMENMRRLYLFGTPIKEFPSSFRNLSGLQWLKLDNEESVQQFAKSSILMVPQLAKNEKILIKKDGELLCLRDIRSNEFLAFCLTWCANLKVLKLYKSDITVVPECIKECRFLRKLVLNNCKQLEKIRGIPPSLREICLNGCEKLEEIIGISFPHSLQYLKAVGCVSLSMSCRSMLLNEKLHEAGNTRFILPSPERGIPEWFEHQSRGLPISFWFRNNFPHIALCLVCKNQEYIHFVLILYINGNRFDYEDDSIVDQEDYGGDNSNFTEIIHIGAKNLVGKDCTLDEALLKNEWNEVEVILHSMNFKDPKPIRFGIHVLNGRSSDIQITNPYRE